MPRKAFVADLQDAINTFRGENVALVKAGDEDGTITFDYVTPQHDGSDEVTTIQAIVPGMMSIRI